MRKIKNPQLEMLKKQPLAYGGELLKKRKARRFARSIDTKHSMHLVLRSSLAKNDWSFRRPHNRASAARIIAQFAKKYGVRLLSAAYAGNHIHMQIKISNRHTYRPFIRAITGSIAMAITGASRWNKNALRDRCVNSARKVFRFWDYRPFSRVVRSYKALLTLRDYIEINKLEGYGYARSEARFLIEWGRAAPA